MTRPIHNDRALEQIGKKFMELRKQTGKTQAVAQKEFGINVGLLEAGKLNLTIVSLRKLCRYYGMTEAEFFENLEI